MLSDAKNVLLAVVFWLASKPARTAVIIVAIGFVTILALTVVLMPDFAIAASASSGSP
ncbi:MAG: hypothetical protein LC121_12215 [Anaerolineae bacterium]|nr:hypothetical protein [Anaerolineae bacterium]